MEMPNGAFAVCERDDESLDLFYMYNGTLSTTRIVSAPVLLNEWEKSI